MRRGADVLIETLESLDVDFVFGLPGVHNLRVYDALARSSKVTCITARHEQGAALMADGYARATGKPGIVQVITGPGGTNIATSVAQAYTDSVPLLVVQSDLSRRQLAGFGGFSHEMRDQVNLFKTIVDHSRLVTSAEQIESAVHEAFEKMLQRRPTPVHINIPQDVLSAPVRSSSVYVHKTPAAEFHADKGQLDQMVRIIRESRKPLIYAGDGVVWADACPDLVSLAETLQAPVVTTTMGKGAFPDSHPLALGNAFRPLNGLAQLCKESDLVIAVGTKLSGLSTGGGGIPLPANLIHIDDSAESIGRFYPTAAAAALSPAAILPALLSHVEKRSTPEANAWVQRAQGLRRESEAVLAEREPDAWTFVSGLRETLSQDAIVVADVSISCYWLRDYFKSEQPRTFLYPYYFHALGFALPASIGAKLAHPNREVVMVAGDGAFMFSPQELAVAAEHQLAIPIIIFNDQCYSEIRVYQEAVFDARYAGIDNKGNPSFVELASAFGIRAREVDSLGNLLTATREALSAEGPTLIEIKRNFQSPVTLFAAGAMAGYVEG